MTDQLQSIDIASVLRQTGPVVSCVVLRATKDDDDNDKKPSAQEHESIDHLVEEIQIDTTPKKNSVEKLLGGPFTFIGQYEEEGIMLMARREFEDSHSGLPRNPHKLQPPFHETPIHGDILVLKVAECEDPLDDDAESSKPVVATNDEFFLNYTKEEYMKFAARTDVVPPALPEDLEEEEEEEDCEDDNNDEEEAGEWSEGEDEEEEEVSEEEAQGAMMNLLMANVVRKFQEENGRGPSTEELLMFKITIAQKLGIPMETAEGDDEEDEEAEKEGDQEDNSEPSSDAKEESYETKKRAADDSDAESCQPAEKKVKFGTEETNEKIASAVLAH